MPVKTLIATPGSSIQETAQQMVAYAARAFLVVECNFNGFKLRANPHDTPIDVTKQYLANSQRVSIEIESSPDGATQARIKKTRQAAMFRAAPRVFPVEVILSVVTHRLLTDMGLVFEFTGHCLAKSGCLEAQYPARSKILAPLILRRFPEFNIPEGVLKLLDDRLEDYPDDAAKIVSAWVLSLGLRPKYIVPVMVSEDPAD